MKPKQRSAALTLVGAIENALRNIKREVEETAGWLATLPASAARARALSLADELTQQVEGYEWLAEDLDEDLASLRRMAKALMATSKISHPARQQAAA
jgi:hypothetical protein